MPRQAPIFATEAVLPTQPWIKKETEKKTKSAPKRRGRPSKKK